MNARNSRHARVAATSKSAPRWHINESARASRKTSMLLLLSTLGVRIVALVVVTVNDEARSLGVNIIKRRNQSNEYGKIIVRRKQRAQAWQHQRNQSMAAAKNIKQHHESVAASAAAWQR